MDKIDHPADIPGTQGQAWRVDLDQLRKSLDTKPENDGMVATWLVEVAYAHPLWHSYAFILLHLRPLPDRRETKFYLEGATHEFIIYALDPKEPRQAAVEGREFFSFLTPSNFAAQIIAEDDGKAVDRIESAIRKVVDGQLSPDTDYIRHWSHLFGDNMMKKGAGETRIMALDEDGKPLLDITIPPKPGPQDMH